MRDYLRRWLYQVWYGEDKWGFVLVPLAWLFGLVVRARAFAYRIGLLKQHRLPVPVLIIGNITVGGSGKTPLLIALCRWFEQRGIKIGVVSRGYGGQLGKQRLKVTAESDPELVGDEPLLIAQSVRCDVAVGQDRVAAARLLCNDPTIKIILSDDGLQHYRLARDIEIIVADGTQLFGNKKLLPAGPLREPVARLQTTDFVIYQQAISADREYFYLKTNAFVSINDSQEQAACNFFAGKKVHALAGIAHPERFFRQLVGLGCEVIPHAFADHYCYQRKDVMFEDEHPIIMTEKDAVKCRHLGVKNAWYLAVEAVIAPEFLQRLTKRVEEILRG